MPSLPKWSETIATGRPAESDLLALDLRRADVRGRRRLRGVSAVGRVDEGAGSLTPSERRLGRYVEHVKLFGFQVGDAIGAIGRQELFAGVGRLSRIDKIRHTIGQDLTVGLGWNVPDDAGAGEGNVRERNVGRYTRNWK